MLKTYQQKLSTLLRKIKPEQAWIAAALVLIVAIGLLNRQSNDPTGDGHAIGTNTEVLDVYTLSLSPQEQFEIIAKANEFYSQKTGLSYETAGFNYYYNRDSFKLKSDADKLEIYKIGDKAYYYIIDEQAWYIETIPPEELGIDFLQEDAAFMPAEQLNAEFIAQNLALVGRTQCPGFSYDCYYFKNQYGQNSGIDISEEYFIAINSNQLIVQKTTLADEKSSKIIHYSDNIEPISVPAEALLGKPIEEYVQNLSEIE